MEESLNIWEYVEPPPTPPKLPFFKLIQVLKSCFLRDKFLLLKKKKNALRIPDNNNLSVFRALW